MDRSAEYIYEIYRNGSFSKAAKKLFVSQPALSTYVKKKESELGFTIFNRSALPLSLTEEGKVYIEMLENIRESEEAMRRQIQGIQNCKSGKLLIGACNYASAFVIPAVYREFSKEYPDVHVDVCETDGQVLREKLKMGLLDLMVDYDPDFGDSEAIPVLSEHLLLAVPASFPVNQKISRYSVTHADVTENRVNYEKGLEDLSSFSGTSFVLCGKGYNMFKQMISLCHESNFFPEVTNSTNHLMMNYNMAKEGVGVALTTDTLIKTASQNDPSVILYPIRLEKRAERTLYLTYKKREHVPQSVKAFAAAAEKWNLTHSI